MFSRFRDWLRADRLARVFWIDGDRLCIDDGFFRASMNRSLFAFGTSSPSQRLSIEGLFEDEGQLREALVAGGAAGLFRKSKWWLRDDLGQLFAYSIPLDSVRARCRDTQRGRARFEIEAKSSGTIDCEASTHTWRRLEALLGSG